MAAMILPAALLGGIAMSPQPVHLHLQNPPITVQMVPPQGCAATSRSGCIYQFRATPGGKAVAVYAGPLGTVPRGELAAANGEKAPANPTFQLIGVPIEAKK